MFVLLYIFAEAFWTILDVEQWFVLPTVTMSAIKPEPLWFSRITKLKHGNCSKGGGTIIRCCLKLTGNLVSIKWRCLKTAWQMMPCVLWTFSFDTPSAERLWKKLWISLKNTPLGNWTKQWNIIVFYKRAQQEGEDARTLSQTVSFVSNALTAWFDRILLGIYDNETRAELLKMRKLDLSKCLHICRAAQSAKSNNQAYNQMRYMMWWIESLSPEKRRWCARTVTVSMLWKTKDVRHMEKSASDVESIIILLQNALRKREPTRRRCHGDKRNQNVKFIRWKIRVLLQNWYLVSENQWRFWLADGYVFRESSEDDHQMQDDGGRPGGDISGWHWRICQYYSCQVSSKCGTSQRNFADVESIHSQAYRSMPPESGEFYQWEKILSAVCCVLWCKWSIYGIMDCLIIVGCVTSYGKNSNLTSFSFFHNHPTKYQMKRPVNRCFYALRMDDYYCNRQLSPVQHTNRYPSQL